MNDEATNNEDLELLMEVSASVDGELPEHRREALESRIANDPRYEEEARFYRWLDETAKRERAPEVGAPEWAALWTRIESGRARPAAAGAASMIRPVFLRVLVPLAAAAAVVITATLVFRGLDPAEAPNGSPEVTSPASPPGNQMPSNGDNIAELKLPGESSNNGDGVRAPEAEAAADDDGEDPEVDPDDSESRLDSEPRSGEDPTTSR